MTRVNARKTAFMLIFAVAEGRLLDCGINDAAPPTLENVLDDFFEPLYFSTLKSEDAVFEKYPDAKTLEYIYALVSQAVSDLEATDGAFSQHLTGWRLERVSAAARACLRTAVAELTLKLPDSPEAVVINETLEIAREFDEEENVPFINGVLGSYVRAEKGEK
ncbi:MAG: hypothetical protein LBQ91_04605 [Oscillospiraceae bacterium]|jgi:N utilization substance protein B|nr:hypothetical protein [Oscillospiraceae bacterium]